ncbi:hypothetical protein BDY17DRAFT_305846 [Neohortaea acidophila]|uniref:Uncharacterized protein n=1 Tax=Neohortaea acidophila TaxID=245834 RepID=A0A6A6PGD2_9PEZI|nr:uncharacterized protein BDY17DRAFT_305846 [Neohortaea acidophila]KAF2478791.1 hypothetical protein BDY17DRAFT_305846 [Neohortaea acidophila]
MPTQRPFFANFLAAFRSNTYPKAQPSLATSGAVAASTQTIWTTASTPAPKTSQSEQSSTPAKPILPKSTTASTTAAVAAAANTQLHPTLQHHVTPQTHLPRSPSSQALPVYGPPNKPQPSYPTAAESRRARRRGSDSSSDSGGFREVKGGNEKWFIGGRTAAGEERYYKLSMVKRERSSDRISADQLSL